MTAVASTYIGTAWMERGACRGFTAFTDLDSAMQADRCADCPVTAKCADYGMQVDRFGYAQGVVFGGMTALDRARLNRSRVREARKQAAA